MANLREGNLAFIDSTGEITTKPTKVAYVVFVPDAANDELVLSKGVSAGNQFVIKASTAKQTLYLDFVDAPLFFPNGVYVKTLSSNATATLVLTDRGR